MSHDGIHLPVDACIHPALRKKLTMIDIEIKAQFIYST